MIILLGIFLFYLLAPIWYVWQNRAWRSYSCRPITIWQRLYQVMYCWYIWPFYKTGFHDGGKYYPGDWGPWYRCTFRWWYAKYHNWRYPLACNFCSARALGVFAHGRYPVSYAVCEDHAHLLSANEEELRQALNV